MVKNGINGAGLSHTHRMENQTKLNQGVTLTHKEAEEYCAYKRQKKISEITAAMRRSESVLTVNDNPVKLFERATRLRQAAVRMNPVEMVQKGEGLKNAILKIDCLVGGNGETLSKVKAYEIKQALKAGAREITCLITPSFVATSRYTELKKELKRLRRAAGKAILKARIERNYPQATLSRLARICSESGAHYFSLPYFDGCESLLHELSLGCQLEVSGVETLAVFKKTAGAGMGRVLTTRAWEIYSEWLKEVEEITVERQEIPSKTEERRSSGGSVPLLLPPSGFPQNAKIS